MDPAPGLQEIGVHQQLPHRTGISGQAEEIRLLPGRLHLPAAVRAFPVLQLACRPKGLAGRAIHALIGALVNVPLFVHRLKNLLDGRDVIGVCGADEAVIGDVHQLPQVLNSLLPLHNLVHKLFGCNAGLLGLRLNLLSMLVGTGEKADVIALQPLIPSHGICGHRAVGMADMQFIRRVINGRGNIKFPLASLAHKNILLI